MSKNKRYQLRNIVFALACTALCHASLHAATIRIRKVASASDLHPLPILTGGRMLTLPSNIENSFGSKDYISQWPGSYFHGKFAGTRAFFRVVQGNEILHVVIDGQAASPLIKPASGIYEVTGMKKSKHTIGVFVATESQAAPNTFGGFAIPANEHALQPDPRNRQIEFIGDSHTVGYGDLSSTHACNEEEVWARTDDTSAFGAITANHYDADYQINAISGRGVVRNYNGSKEDTLPQAYPYILFDKKQKYSDPHWNPQVLVIALGTNDFSTPLNAGEPWKTRAALHADYEATYANFLKSLRAQNPKAYIIVWATDVANGEVEAEAKKVVEQLQKSGDRNITFLPINGLSFTACNFHPSLADEKVISAKLIQLIDARKHSWKISR